MSLKYFEEKLFRENMIFFFFHLAAPVRHKMSFTARSRETLTVFKRTLKTRCSHSHLSEDM